MRRPALLLALTAALASCGGTATPQVAASSASPSASVASASAAGPVASEPTVADDGSVTERGVTFRTCQPLPGLERHVLADGSAPLPPQVELRRVAQRGNPEGDGILSYYTDDRGLTEEQAYREMWVQAIGGPLTTDAQQLPGYAGGAYGSVVDGEPFELWFEGDVVPDLDVDAYGVAPVGLVVVTGAAPRGLPQPLAEDAFAAADEFGLRTVGANGLDIADGTLRTEVVDATQEQVDAWESAVPSPQACLAFAPRAVPCDADVVADARDRATAGSPVLPNEGEAPPTDERAEQVRRSHLGLTLDESRAKAEQEGRSVREVVVDGVGLGSTDDLQPGRLSLTTCEGVVVDTEMDLEGFEGGR